MNVFVTGGTGIVGVSAVTALLRRGHTVRLFSRNATADAKQWPEGVEPRDGSVADPAALAGSMDGCDTVVHLAAVVAEDPPESTFQAINIEGTKNVVAEAERAGLRRVIFISSLGADRGASGYHQSKRTGERIVRAFSRDWTVLRPGNIYGGGDQIISLMLTILRCLPCIPVINGGDQPFQPMWVGDFAEALATVVERQDLVGGSFDLTGPDRTSMNDLVSRMEGITGRSVVRLPMSGGIATILSNIGEKLGLTAPITPDQILMLEEGSVIDDPSLNLLPALLEHPPTTLDDGLAKVADALPEQLPDEGVGRMQHRHVWADIANPDGGAEGLFERFRSRFSEITPWHMDLHAEPDTRCELRAGATLTMALPVRGNVQVRVEEISARSLTLVTLEGHPLAGAVHFSCHETAPGTVRFQVKVYDRSSTFLDWLVMSTLGGMLQLSTWKTIVAQVVKESGGVLLGDVRHHSDSLDTHEADRIEQWLQGVVTARKQAENVGAIPEDAPRDAAPSTPDPVVSSISAGGVFSGTMLPG